MTFPNSPAPSPYEMTLFVEHVNVYPQKITPTIERRKAAVTFEIKRAAAKELIEKLTARLESEPHNENFRVELTGRRFV